MENPQTATWKSLDSDFDCLRRLQASAIFPGAAFGLLLGLSNSPVLGVAITSAFTFAATLIKPKVTEPQKFSLAALPPGANPPVIPPPSQQESSAQIRSEYFWLPWLSIGLIIGVLFGIWLRANNFLDWKPKDIPSQMRELGFNENQVHSIMDHQHRVLTGKYDSLSQDLLDLGYTEPGQHSHLMARLADGLKIQPTRQMHVDELRKAETTKPSSSPSKELVHAENPTGLWHGKGSAWYPNLISAIDKLPDDATTITGDAAHRAFADEVVRLRSLLSGFKPQIDILPSDNLDRQLYDAYEAFLKQMAESSEPNMKTRLKSLNRIERSITEIRQQMKSKSDTR